MTSAHKHISFAVLALCWIMIGLACSSAQAQSLPPGTYGGYGYIPSHYPYMSGYAGGCSCCCPSRYSTRMTGNPNCPNMMSGGPYPNATLATNPSGSSTMSASRYPSSMLASNPYCSGSNPYLDPYAYNSESPAAGYTRGTAELITAQGNYVTSLHQAGLIKEQVKQAEIDTRRKVFDEQLYERRNTPTPEDDRQMVLAQDLSRSMNNAPIADVLSGHALNTILSDLAKQDGKQLADGDASALVDADVLRHLNLVSGGIGNPALLKNEGRLTWPLALRDDVYKREREQLDSLVPDAIHQAVNGKVDSGALTGIRNALAGMRRTLTANARDLTANQYIEAARFLGFFDDAVKVLERPEAGNYLAKASEKSTTIGGLVKSMISKGLTFAAAVPGDEPSYLVIYRGLVNYARNTKTGGSLQITRSAH